MERVDCKSNLEEQGKLHFRDHVGFKTMLHQRGTKRDKRNRDFNLFVSIFDSQKIVDARYFEGNKCLFLFLIFVPEYKVDFDFFLFLFFYAFFQALLLSKIVCFFSACFISLHFFLFLIFDGVAGEFLIFQIF